MSKEVEKKFGKDLGEKTEDNHLIGRWYLSSDGEKVYVIKGKDDDGEWIADKCTREGHYESGKWYKDIKLKESMYHRDIILLPENIKTMSDVEKYVEDSVTNALALIDGDVEPTMSDSTDVVPTGKDELSRMLTVQKEWRPV